MRDPTSSLSWITIITQDDNNNNNYYYSGRGQNFLEVDDVVSRLLLCQHPIIIKYYQSNNFEGGGEIHSFCRNQTFPMMRTMTLITVTQPYALQAEGWVCRLYPPETQCSDSSGGGSPQSPVTHLQQNAFVFWSTWPCLVTQCLRTERTLIVAALEVIDIFLFAEARNASLLAWGVPGYYMPGHKLFSDMI